MVPQSVLVSLLSALCSLTIGPLVDAHSSTKGFTGSILGGSKGGQPAEVFATAYHVLEKGRDRKNQGAVGVGDVANYHDSLMYGVMLRSLLHRGVPPAWAKATVRIQRMPFVILQIGAFFTGSLLRERGALTGNPLAAVFGKIVMEDVMAYARPALLDKAFRISESDALLPQAWSDNVVWYCPSQNDCLSTMSIIKHALWQIARLRFKDGSLAIIKSSVSRYDPSVVNFDRELVRIAFEEPLLGVLLCANGSSVGQRSRVIGALHGAFMRSKNIFSKNALKPIDKCRFWKLVMAGIVSYFVLVLRPNQRNIITVDRANNKLVGIFLHLARDPMESQAVFFKRRAAGLKELKDACKCSCVEVWLQRLVSWCTHICRHPLFPLARLIAIQDDTWLAVCRSSNRYSRPACRASAGFVSRWSEGWWSAVESGVESGWKVERGNRPQEAIRIEFLRTFLLGEDARGLPDELVAREALADGLEQ